MIFIDFLLFLLLLCLISSSTQLYTTPLYLPPGTHRIKFIIEDQWKCADDMPTAVDDGGNLVNYVEVGDGSSGVEGSGEKMGMSGNRGQEEEWVPGLTEVVGESSFFSFSYYLMDVVMLLILNKQLVEEPPPWTDTIPTQLLHAAQLEENYLVNRNKPNAPPPPSIPHPPTLPRHLEKVILNVRTGTSAGGSSSRVGLSKAAGGDATTGPDDNSVLPVPNHVVLNHLGTSAIKGGVLAVGTTTRYHRKVRFKLLLSVC